MTSKVDLDRVLGLALRHIRKEYHVDHVWNNVEETLKLRQPCKNENTAGVLGLAPCHKDWEKQCRYKWLIRPLIHRYPPKCHSFVGLDREIGSSAPARSGSCTSIQMLHTHTLEKNWIIGVIRLQCTHLLRSGSLYRLYRCWMHHT